MTDTSQRRWHALSYYDGAAGRLVVPGTVTAGADYCLSARVVVPIRAEDYPVLAAIWDNDEDDIFDDDPPGRPLN